MYKNWRFDGIIWDELKSLGEEDHHPEALERFGGVPSEEQQVAATVEFFGDINTHARGHKADTIISCFIYAHHFSDAVVSACSRIEGQDYFGLDGHCWPESAGKKGESNKNLIDWTPRYVAANQEAGIGTMALIESQGQNDEQLHRSIQYMPQFLAMGVDHIMYYYYGAAAASPEGAKGYMDSLGPMIRDWRRRA